MKKSIKSVARQFGYEIAKSHPPIRSELNSLRLAVEREHALRPEFFFVQVGANDGVRADPINEMVRRLGLRGILVEPQPELYQQLVENYADQPQLMFEQAAIFETDGEKTLYRIEDAENLPPWANGVATFDRQHLIKHKTNIPDIESRIIEQPVATLTFDSLLRKHGQAGPISLLQIDAEGMDDRILELVDLQVHRPRIINFEHRHITFDREAACYRRLEDNGYSLLIGGSDTLAVLEDE